jgi:hypothetical protein
LLFQRGKKKIFKRCEECNSRGLLTLKSDGKDLCAKCYAFKEIEKNWKQCPLCASALGFDKKQISSSFSTELILSVKCNSCGTVWLINPVPKDSERFLNINVDNNVTLKEYNDSAYEVPSSLKNKLRSIEWWVSYELNSKAEKQYYDRFVPFTSICLFKDEAIIEDITSAEIKKHEIDMGTLYVHSARLVLTNLRLLLSVLDTIRTSDLLIRSDKFSRSIEFSDILSTEIIKDTLKIVFNDTAELIIKSDLTKLEELKKELDLAISSKVALVSFKDEDVLYRQSTNSLLGNGTLSSYDTFDPPGSTFTNTKMCITNKRIIYYRIEQIKNIVSEWNGKAYSVNVNWLEKPSLRLISIPFDDIQKIYLKPSLFFGKRIMMKLTKPPIGWRLEDTFSVSSSLEDCEYAKKIQGKIQKDNEYILSLPDGKDKLNTLVLLKKIIPEKIDIQDLASIK